MNKKGKIFLLLLLPVIILAGTILLFIPAGRRQLPVEEIREASALLSEAKKYQAHIYAQEMYLAAETSYDSAMTGWKLENQRLLFLRNYNQVVVQAQNVSRLARMSIERSRRISGDLNGKIEKKLAEVRKMLTSYDRYFSGLPIQVEMGTAVARARQSLQEGIAAAKNGQEGIALEKAGEAARIIAEANTRGREILNSYFTGYRNWQEWVEKTLKHSRISGRSCVLIDKYARSCILVRPGLPNDTFEVELGPNWMGDKKYQGDRSTPEGIYQVRALKSGNGTRYYKALLLNYPNEEDKKRFHEKKESGEYGPGVTIGGMIEIHGHGGKGSDWTEGCIALNDKDMDIIFKNVRVGTEVVIVGSLMSLEEIIR